jgi:hypothetical protein
MNGSPLQRYPHKLIETVFSVAMIEILHLYNIFVGTLRVEKLLKMGILKHMRHNHASFRVNIEKRPFFVGVLAQCIRPGIQSYNRHLLNINSYLHRHQILQE